MTQQQETMTMYNLPLHMHNTIQCLLIVHIDLQKSLLILWNLFNFILQLFLLLVIFHQYLLNMKKKIILKMMIQILILKMMNNKIQHPSLIQSTCLNKKMKCHKRIYLKMKHKLKDPIPLIQIIQYKIIQNMQTLTMKCLKKCHMPNLNLLLQMQMQIA